MSDGVHFLQDLQASPPDVRIGLSLAGVSGVRKAIRIRYGESEKLISADIDCTVDLDPKQKGVHMSRFTELFEEAIEEVVIEEALLVEQLDHLPSGGVDNRDVARGRVLERLGPDQSFRKASDGRQRRPQIVCGEGDQLRELGLFGHFATVASR